MESKRDGNQDREVTMGKGRGYVGRLKYTLKNKKGNLIRMKREGVVDGMSFGGGGRSLM